MGMLMGRRGEEDELRRSLTVAIALKILDLLNIKV